MMVSYNLYWVANWIKSQVSSEFAICAKMLSYSHRLCKVARRAEFMLCQFSSLRNCKFVLRCQLSVPSCQLCVFKVANRVWVDCVPGGDGGSPMELPLVLPPSGRSIVASKKGDGSQVKESTDSSTTIEEEDIKGKLHLPPPGYSLCSRWDEQLHLKVVAEPSFYIYFYL